MQKSTTEVQKTAALLCVQTQSQDAAAVQRHEVYTLKLIFQGEVHRSFPIKHKAVRSEIHGIIYNNDCGTSLLSASSKLPSSLSASLLTVERTLAERRFPPHIHCSRKDRELRRRFRDFVSSPSVVPATNIVNRTFSLPDEVSTCAKFY